MKEAISRNIRDSARLDGIETPLTVGGYIGCKNGIGEWYCTDDTKVSKALL